jgi:hypothetical protein
MNVTATPLEEHQIFIHAWIVGGWPGRFRGRAYQRGGYRLLHMRDALSANRRMTPGGPAAILVMRCRAAAHKVRARPGTACEGAAMKQLRITKRHRPDDWRLEPLPLDPRDPDIVRAKELARRSRAVAPRPGPARQAGN